MACNSILIRWSWVQFPPPYSEFSLSLCGPVSITRANAQMNLMGIWSTSSCALVVNFVSKWLRKVYSNGKTFAFENRPFPSSCLPSLQSKIEVFCATSNMNEKLFS